MPNEFLARNGLIAQNNSTITGSLNVTGGITGSLLGTASFAATASYLTGYISPFPYTGSAIISGSLTVTGSLTTTDNITSAGTLTAQTLVVQTVTSSVSFITGSTRFGSLVANTHVFTGSMSVTGSVTATSFAGSGANLTSIPNAALSNSTISGIALGSNLATLTISTGLSGTSYNGSGAVTIANTGVTSNVAGTGISVSGATGAVTITNSGVTSIVAGTNISISGATGAVTITNGITNNNQLTNGAGYITSYTETDTLGSVTNRGSSTSQNITFSNGRKGLIGVYDAAQTQAIFAMGIDYILTNGGASSTIGPLYGLAWSYNPDYGGAGNNPQSKAGLNHQLLHMQNGVTTTAIGSGIWTSGAISAGGTITAVGGASGGFLSATYASGYNRIWAFGNATPYGLGYYQGGTDYIGFHFGNTASPVFTVNSSGNGSFTGTIGASNFSGTHSGASSGTNTGDQTNISGYSNSTYNINYNGGQAGGITLNVGTSGVYRTEGGSGGTKSYAPLLHLAASDTMWQIQADYAGGTDIQWRSGYAGTWYTWWHFLHSGNYTSYSPSLTGSGASGTWGISVTGTASNITAYSINQNLATTSSPTFDYVNLSVLAGSAYGALMYANNGTSYCQWRYAGSKNGWAGFSCGYSNVNGVMYDSSGNGGVYKESAGRWYFYYSIGNVCFGINDSATSSAYGLYVTGSIYTTGTLTQASDIRKKTNIATIDNALEKIIQMRGVFFTKIGEEEKGRQTGVIAQEINEILPEVVIHAADVDEYSVAYGNVVGILIEGMKELNAKLEAANTQIENLKQLIK